MRNIFFIKKKIQQTVDFIEKFKPDIIFSVDAPDFVFQVANKVKKNKKIDTKFYHFVAPTIWAWREKRALKIKKLLDKVYLLFDFEQTIFSKYNINSMFVGHPFFENFIEKTCHKDFSNKNLISFCPGSRKSEIKKFMPIFKDIMNKLGKSYKFHFGVTNKFVSFVKDELKGIDREIAIETDEQIKNENYKNSLLTVAKSGTVTLNLCAMQSPIITIYKLSFLNYLIIKPFVKSKFANIINVMARKELIPELIQFNCTSEKIINTINNLSNNRSKLNEMVSNYNSVLQRVSGMKTSKLVLDDLKKNI